jgi:hypothetical protein
MKQSAHLSLEREQVLQVRDERRRANGEFALRVFRTLAGTALLVAAVFSNDAERLRDVLQTLLTLT